jgi:transcriptional regulator with XRE-family HTH domain
MTHPESSKLLLTGYTPMATFAEVLRGLREKAGLSQRDLAERSGISQKSISVWEMGESQPILSNLQKLCAALGVGCEVFFESDAPPAKKPGKRKK